LERNFFILSGSDSEASTSWRKGWRSSSLKTKQILPPKWLLYPGSWAKEQGCFLTCHQQGFRKGCCFHNSELRFFSSERNHW
jgi:hypothetical protein